MDVVEDVAASAVERSTRERVVGDDPDQGAFEGADVVGYSFGDHVQDVVVGDRDPVEYCPLAENRDARGEVGRWMSATNPDSKRSRRRSSTSRAGAGVGRT